MKVSAAQPFQIVYSLYQHEYLGFLFESYVVHVNEKGKLTFRHQNISYQNAREFSSGANEIDYQLIKLIDSMHQNAIVNHFSKKQVKPEEFFTKIYDKEKGKEDVQTEISNYLEIRKSKILSLLGGKEFYEMGKDGFPAWRKIIWPEEKATVLFHFWKNIDNTHYFPTIKYKGEKLEWQYKGGILICNNPAWLLLGDKLYQFEKEVDGNKLKPFLNKKFIVIPKKVEDTYFKKFVAPLMASFDVRAKGFKVYNEKIQLKSTLFFSEINAVDENNQNGQTDQSNKILFELSFNYGNFQLSAAKLNPVSVKVEKEGSEYSFHRILRNLDIEKKTIKYLESKGMQLNEAKALKTQTEAFNWLNQELQDLNKFGIEVRQQQINGRKYFVGDANLEIQIKENIDWFDINAMVKFGAFEISFKELREMMVRNKREIKLPNGEIAIIPEKWFVEYSELMAFTENDPEALQPRLKKHHVALVEDLSSGDLARVSISNKLRRLKNFKKLDQIQVPDNFKGQLRPYQKSGFDWLNFLNHYKFGGCLADDMGLGKTIQTLAILQAEKERKATNASLIIMPTSLIYNWEMEINKFTPTLKTLVYSGTGRNKNVDQFQNYDIILTSYGIVRLDVEILKTYYFNYLILDESQTIKNPSSNIAIAVLELTSRNKLILTGTPIENSTLDLWSQLSFINPGLLGSQSFFKKEFLVPIEKRKIKPKNYML